ncbi:MAG: hypothetical protein JW981_03770 [Anaerolineae bacterium]|nr:hypothetical protein [Anaerolineae bacterium]
MFSLGALIIEFFLGFLVEVITDIEENPDMRGLKIASLVLLGLLLAGSLCALCACITALGWWFINN